LFVTLNAFKNRAVSLDLKLW